MKTIEEQKAKLERKKLKLAVEENRLKEKERKMRTRHLIEVGGLLVKARLDYLSKAALYGALLSISSELDQNPNIIHRWEQIGKEAFEKEQANKFAVILKFASEPNNEIRQTIRKLGLKYNRIKQEWYGYVHNLDSLKETVRSVEHQIEAV